MKTENFLNGKGNDVQPRSKDSNVSLMYQPSPVNEMFGVVGGGVLWSVARIKNLLQSGLRLETLSCGEASVRVGLSIQQVAVGLF